MTTADTPRTGCDTSDMRLVHLVFRAVFADGPMLVEAVPAGDDRRRRAVGDHLRELAMSLRRHHETEDVLLWDDLERRAPACALHVGLMRAQHHRMGDALVEVEEALPRWVETDAAADRRRAHDAMVEVDRLLVEHLGDEERLILPAASEVFTQAEWDRLGEYARKESKASMLFPQIGFMLDAMPPAEGAKFLRETMPAPVLWLWRLIGRRQYRRYRERVYGTASV